MTQPSSSGRRSTRPTRPSRDEALRTHLATLRDALARGVVITADRVQEAMDDAVRRGRMTRQDAEDLAESLISSGRRQTQDVLSDIEQLLGRAGGETVLRAAGRARRAAGLGSSFPIPGYEQLTAAQVTAQLDGLTPAQLRNVRDHERGAANRKTVLRAVEKKLG
jgi:polyhydroxyalkanoate synthesis regulator phasin